MTSAVPLANIPKDHRASVAIDLGAESCRVSLLRWIDGRPRMDLVHRFPNAARQLPGPTGGLRWDLAAIESGIDTGLRRCAEIASEGIRSLAVDGWAVDYVRTSASTPPRALADPFCYRDERTVLAWEALNRIIPPARLRAITGVELMRINTLYQQHADFRNGTDVSTPWLNLPEYILVSLGGLPVSEHTNASHTQMIDLATRQWSPEIFTAAGLDITRAPRLVPPGTAVGTLSGPLAALPAFRSTTLIAPACHDTASAIAGIPAHGDDWAYISSGTWSLVGALLDTPCNTPEASAENFTNLAAAGGRICFHKNVNGMWLLRQSLDHWQAQGSTWLIEDLIAAAEHVPAPDYLLDVDDPDLLLPGRMPERINAQFRTRALPTLDESPSNAPAFASLIFHSLAARYAVVLGNIQRYTGRKFRRLFIVGGASRNLFLNRLVAESTGLEVCRGALESATAGNFAIQLATLEHPTPNLPPDASQIARWTATLLEHTS